jgi:DNA-binding Xre family transcriptional regulator
MENRAGDELVDRLLAHYDANTDTELAAKIGTAKQNIYSMRQRKKRDVTHRLMMMMLDELESK